MKPHIPHIGWSLLMLAVYAFCMVVVSMCGETPAKTAVAFIVLTVIIVLSLIDLNTDTF